MSRYCVDGKILDTGKAVDHWKEERDFDGKNHVSRATGSQWEHEELFLSSKGTFWLLESNDWQGLRSKARVLTPLEASRWLLIMGYGLPNVLASFEDELVE